MKNAQLNWIGLVCATCLLLAATAKSDTYNFYFSKPKKKASAEATAPADDETPQAPAAPVEKSPAPAAPATSEALPAAPPSTPIVVSGGGNGQPVIINNTNNITIPTAVQAGRVVAPKETPSSPTLLTPAESSVTATLVSTTHEERPRWHFGLGVLHAPTATRLEASGAESGTYVSLGFDVTHWLGLNLYGGGLVYDSGAPETHFYGGADLEIHPFHITIGHLDLLELGFLAGGSNVRAAYDNWGSFHLGARATLSFDQQFGLTVATRANFGTVMFEGGLVTRF